MKRTGNFAEFNDGWCFATINNRLAEIYFTKEEGLYGYHHISRDQYSKKEQKVIDEDVGKYQFSYRGGVFCDKRRDITFPLGKITSDS